MTVAGIATSPGRGDRAMDATDLIRALCRRLSGLPLGRSRPRFFFAAPSIVRSSPGR